MKESPAEYKLALYYSPLAEKLNQDQLEQLPEEVLELIPSHKDNALKSAPLLEN